jgi:hypothetical protein
MFRLRRRKVAVEPERITQENNQDLARSCVAPAKHNTPSIESFWPSSYCHRDQSLAEDSYVPSEAAVRTSCKPCKRSHWRAFMVTADGGVLMFSKLFRVHSTRYRLKCIKEHSDP